MTVTSGSSCNPDSFSVWASSSNSDPFNISTFRIFCSMGSSQNFSRSIHFNCFTVSMLVTSRVKASPFKMFTVNSFAMAASTRPNICGVSHNYIFNWIAFNLNSKYRCRVYQMGKLMGKPFKIIQTKSQTGGESPYFFKQVFLSSRCNIAQHALGLETDQRILLMEIAAVLMGVMMNYRARKKTSGEKSPKIL